MSRPGLLLLSNEVLIEIIARLCIIDIYACQCTCRELNKLIVSSQLIRYIKRIAASGLFDSDPLEPGLLSIPDRLDALERWEAACRG